MNRSTPAPRVRRPKRAEVRRRILNAAAQLLESRGLDQASLEDIAEAAGFSKGAVYSNFAGKDELLLALISQRVEQRIAAVEKARARKAKPAPRARATSRTLESFLREEPAWHRLFLEFWLRATRDRRLGAAFAAQRRAIRALIARQLEEAAAEAGVTFATPSRVLATIVLALSNGVAIEHLADPGAVPAGTLSTALELLWRAAGAPVTTDS